MIMSGVRLNFRHMLRTFQDVCQKDNRLRTTLTNWPLISSRWSSQRHAVSRSMATELKSDFGESMSIYRINDLGNFKSAGERAVHFDSPVPPDTVGCGAFEYASYTNHIRRHLMEIYRRAACGPFSIDRREMRFLSNSDVALGMDPEQQLFSYALSSTLKKRKKKMNKHKYQKLRKRMRSLRRRLGK
jgi:hypothetical protein